MPAFESNLSCWREVTARVHVSLSPQQLASGGKAAAARVAFQSLLMRYSPELNGVAVAYRGGLTFKSRAVFVGASPFPHVLATARLLVFAPPRGAELVGVVTHVGPDHVGITVLQAFHAVLPLEPLREYYAYDYRFEDSGLVRKWRCLHDQPGFNHEICIDRQIRFVVQGIKPSETGLFQILASLNDADRELQTADYLPPLGVLDLESEVAITKEPRKRSIKNAAKVGAQIQYDDEDEPQRIDMITINKRSSTVRAAGASLLSQGALHAGSLGTALKPNPFGNALAPVPLSSTEPRKHSKKKKQAESSGERRRSTGSLKKKERKMKVEMVVNETKEEPDDVIVSQETSQVRVLTQADLPVVAEHQSSVKRKEDKKARKERKRREKEVRRKALEARRVLQLGIGENVTAANKTKSGDEGLPDAGTETMHAAATRAGNGVHNGSPQHSKNSPKLARNDPAPSPSPSPATKNVSAAPLNDLARNGMKHTPDKSHSFTRPDTLSRKDAMRIDALEAVNVGREAESNSTPHTIVKHEVPVEANEMKGEPIMQSQESTGSVKMKKRKKRKREPHALTPDETREADGRKRKKKRIKKEQTI